MQKFSFRFLQARFLLTWRGSPSAVIYWRRSPMHYLATPSRKDIKRAKSFARWRHRNNCNRWQPTGWLCGTPELNRRRWTTKWDYRKRIYLRATLTCWLNCVTIKYLLNDFVTNIFELSIYFMSQHTSKLHNFILKITSILYKILLIYVLEGNIHKRSHHPVTNEALLVLPFCVRRTPCFLPQTGQVACEMAWFEF